MLLRWVSWRASLTVKLDSLKPGAQAQLVTEITQGGLNIFITIGWDKVLS